MLTPAGALGANQEGLSDEALVKLAKEGDFASFEALFLRHRTLVYRFCYQMVGRRDDAEDMVQEVFVRAFQNLDRYRDEARFTTWLLRIAANLGTDRARMVSRRHTLEQQEYDRGLSWMTNPEQENPVDNLEMEEKRSILRRALKALPEHHRTVVILRDIQEKDYDEIAQILGCSVGGAKLRVHRARKALKDRVAPLLEGAS